MWRRRGSNLPIRGQANVDPALREASIQRQSTPEKKKAAIAGWF